ncbi:Ureidoglycolate lyase [Coccidioides posadasii str. Silveira]|uniref:Ureidoglycolate hydrolase, putative n=1 Tax=Coccidioides posadasii (strain C735) TaxID=222929 RepID=C5P2P6_COCP7|nr:ureidoglycolate hydrolase, putative [Coccidioides posadasii C735 delta SOWgp]EER28584.1 ureidoglycolate hydrolase, putative [Coccidioides posadasii C735 delta SOWgp]QVM06437.1 Ureidoglycolate lyase [Coccidioides posadasii str. Silveira]|eukprot:XP_003070729.1 ureidoglycolate hydrolase, putative [Coccidioides posadasii C735 delta SOWgp]
MHLPFLSSGPKPAMIGVSTLSSKSFAPYGTVISPPLPNDLVAAPSHLPSLPSKPTEPTLVNQGYAIKYSPVSPMENSYGTGGEARQPASPRISLFSCFPRKLRESGDSSARLLFDVQVLERHPYTSQTFIPLSTSSRGRGNGSRDANSPSTTIRNDAIYLIIVAPSLTGQTVTVTVKAKDDHAGLATIRDPPDLSNLQAFIAKPGQAITYATGTWHAPMVVLGEKRIDFVVIQFMNGVEDDDCQIVTFDGIAVGIPDPAINQKSRARL